MDEQQMLSSYTSDVPPLIANRYEVIEKIARGGAAYIFRVKDLQLENDILGLKLIVPPPGTEASFFQRFRQEALIARRLSHPNIVRIFDFGSIREDCHYITMEYVDGPNLNEFIFLQPHRRLSVEQALLILLEIALALDFAHEAGIVHRDVKPENVLISSTGTIKLGDFGTAKLLTVDKKITTTGHVIGTPMYMAPEQIRGEPPDLRSDIYSLGIMAYELVSGKLPFESALDNVMATFTMHLNHPVPQLREQGIDVPEWYQDFVEICTEKRVEARFRSAGEIAQVIIGKLQSLGFEPRIHCLPSAIRVTSQKTQTSSFGKYLKFF